MLLAFLKRRQQKSLLKTFITNTKSHLIEWWNSFNSKLEALEDLEFYSQEVAEALEYVARESTHLQELSLH